MPRGMSRPRFWALFSAVYGMANAKLDRLLFVVHDINARTPREAEPAPARWWGGHARPDCDVSPPAQRRDHHRRARSAFVVVHATEGLIEAWTERAGEVDTPRVAHEAAEMVVRFVER